MIDEKAAERQSLADPQRWLALTVMLFAGFMDLLDLTIVNVTIPSIIRDLHASYTQAEWVVAGYALGFSAVLIIAGRLGDIFGRKRLFLAGMTGFTIASALCGIAVSPGMLIGTRLLQGAMAGTMVPQILSIIRANFPANERASAYGLFGAVVGCASAAGLIVGGLLVQWNVLGLTWRPVFLVNVPIGIAAVIAGWYVIRDARSQEPPRLDLIGAALALTATLLVLYPLTEGRSLGWPAWTFAMLGGAVALIAVLIGYERRRAAGGGSPLVALGLFRARTFSYGMALLVIFAVSFAGFFFIWTLYLQVGLGWTPEHAGLTGVSFAVAAMIGSGFSAAALTPRFGRRVLMAGALANAAGFAGYSVLVSHYGEAIGSWQMVAPLTMAGLGFGVVIAPIIDLILTDVPVADAGAASGLLSAIQEFGMAVGVAIAGIVFFTYLGGSHGAARIDALTTATVHSARAPGFIRAFSLALWYPVGILLIFYAGLFALPRRMRPRDLDAELAQAEGS
ncbi:MAG TPA: MFS transporter [Streptosporangiaceae bacterium]|nr:MFS transporter [Streptosporangiaceae bacterium]